MASKGETFWGRLWERFVSFGDDNRVNGIVKKAHDAVEGLTERVESALASSEPKEVEDEAAAKPAPLPPVRKPAAPARTPARSRATASPARSPARAGTKVAPARKPRGAASEPSVEDAAAPRPEPIKPAAPRKRAPLKAVPPSGDTASAEPAIAAATPADELKKPARAKKPAAAKPKAGAVETTAEDAAPVLAASEISSLALNAALPPSPENQPPSDTEKSEQEGGASTVENPTKTD